MAQDHSMIIYIWNHITYKTFSLQEAINHAKNVGVSTGSTIGPLLFLIFAIDMSNSSVILKTYTICRWHNYLILQKNRVCVTQINENYLENASKWLTTNKQITNLQTKSQYAFYQ